MSTSAERTRVREHWNGVFNDENECLLTRWIKGFAYRYC